MAAEFPQEATAPDRGVARGDVLAGHTGFLCDPSHKGWLAVALQPQK
jgi:hypothetical protein